MSGADLVTEIPIQRFDVHQWYGFPNFCQQFLWPTMTPLRCLRCEGPEV